MKPNRKPVNTGSKITSPDDPQYSLFSGIPGGSAKSLRTALSSGRRFVSGDASAIFLGTVPLEEHLRQSGQTAAFTVAKLLDAQNWDGFEARYAATGRAPYSPRLMLGLILYGVMQGVHSLRDLERMARLDLGCMWVTGGIAPDHTNIGRFITMHEKSLTEDFFESLTASILTATGSSSARLAGDGTVIEAACSHYNLLKEEALKAKLGAARLALEAAPDDADLKQEVQASERCAEIFKERQLARKRSGRGTDTLAVSGTEPDAMVQRLKRGRGVAASYKPSVLANEDRIITAMDLDPSSETKVIGQMLDQSARVVGAPAQELLLDAGYFDDTVIAATLDRDVSMLCPEGVEPGKPKASKVHHKSEFEYDPYADTYRCPAGQVMILLRRSDGSAQTRPYSLYGTSACGQCAIRAKCTKTAKREIKRHPEDEQRDALRQVMQQRQIGAVFGQRKAMVEPVFSHLRVRQGLNRFRRTGLEGVKREFALHVLAFNLSRAVALMRALLALQRFPAASFVHKPRSGSGLSRLLSGFQCWASFIYFECRI